MSVLQDPAVLQVQPDQMVQPDLPAHQALLDLQVPLVLRDLPDLLAQPDPRDRKVSKV